MLALQSKDTGAELVVTARFSLGLSVDQHFTIFTDLSLENTI